MMNLEFLQALASKQEDKQTTTRNQFQEEYAAAANTLKSALTKIGKDLRNNQQYQKEIDGFNVLPFSKDVIRELKIRQAIVEEAYQKHEWYEKHKLHLEARWRLLVIYGDYVSALPGCPREIQDLFNPLQFKKMLGLPIELRLVDLAMKTEW